MRFINLILFILFGATSFAAVEPPREPETLLGSAPPYVPRQTEYSLEGGMLSAKDDLAWMSAVMGTHLGHCVFVSTDTCQQYLDGHFAVAAREGETQTHYFASVRWQYINIPDRYSTYWRLLGGAAYIARSGSDRFWRPVFGGGLGVTTYLHEKVDLRLEMRGMVSDRAYLLPVVAVNIKVDRLLTVFVQRLRAIGYGTVETAIEATGTAIKATGEGIGGVYEGVKQPFKSEKPSESKKP